MPDGFSDKKGVNSKVKIGVFFKSDVGKKCRDWNGFDITMGSGGDPFHKGIRFEEHFKDIAPLRGDNVDFWGYDLRLGEFGDSFFK